MDLSGHENCSTTPRPDLTIPMPSCLVPGAMGDKQAAVAQAQVQALIKPTSSSTSTPTPTLTPPPALTPPPTSNNQQLILSPNNGNATPGTPLDLPKSPDGASAAKKPVRYRECLKNHAAGIGGHALDGCGEFMLNKEDESSLLCSACDCHRNFHRREVEGEKSPSMEALMLEASRASGGGGKRGPGSQDLTPGSAGMKKRFRTKFSNEQKERMFVLSEKLGWRIQKHDEAEVAQFCADTGVKRHVLKVWMHNNKHTFGNKRPM